MRIPSSWDIKQETSRKIIVNAYADFHIYNAMVPTIQVNENLRYLINCHRKKSNKHNICMVKKGKIKMSLRPIGSLNRNTVGVAEQTTCQVRFSELMSTCTGNSKIGS